MTLVLIKNANVYAPEPLGTQHLLIGGSRILWMGKEPIDLPVALRKVSTIIDAAGLRTVPGLIDGHVHVTGGGGEAGFRTRVPPVPLSRFTTPASRQWSACSARTMSLAVRANCLRRSTRCAKKDSTPSDIRAAITCHSRH